MATATESLTFRCNRALLQRAFAEIVGVAPSRSPKPILQNIKMAVGPDGASLIATDLEVAITREVSGVTSDRPASLILPAAKVGQILRASSDDDLTIDLEDGNLTIRGARSKFTLPSSDPAEFPEPPAFDSEDFASIPAADLRRLIRRTTFATDVESTRYALGGVLFEFGDGTLAGVGTDGRRLARVVVPCEGQGGFTPPGKAPVIPTKCLNLLLKSLEDTDPPVHVRVDADRSVMFRTHNATIYSRLVEGRFPRYQDVFPAEATAVIPIGVGPLLAATQQAMIVTSEESRGVDFRFDCGMLSLSSQAPDAGSSTVDLPIDYDGQAIEITFDPRYLIDALKVLDESANISVELIDHKNAAVFRTEDDYTYVVMPLTSRR